MKYWWKNFAYYVIVLYDKFYNASHILYVLSGFCEYKLVFVKT
jgi:hypothetical protein